MEYTPLAYAVKKSILPFFGGTGTTSGGICRILLSASILLASFLFPAILLAKRCAMATITIRKLAPEVVERLKARAALQGHSMEQEARDLLTYRLAPRETALHEAQALWSQLEPPTADEVSEWILAARMGER